MKTDSEPYSDQPPGSFSPNAAFAGNFYSDDGSADGYNDGYAVTGSTSYLVSQNYLTDAGAYTSAPSHYGTLDQGGNLFEWNEGLSLGLYRGIRGGCWRLNESFLRASIEDFTDPTIEYYDFGFRVSEVPEPATMGLLALGGLMLVARRPAACPQ